MSPFPRFEPRHAAAAKLGLLGSLYFSQGLPFGFFTQSLPVLLRQHGASLTQVGLSSLLAAPWALKFVWAPLVDRYGSARWGWRRSWIAPLQLAAILVLLALSLLIEAGRFPLLLAGVFLLNLLAATQDIATDALAVDLLEPDERGFANGIQVAGYRVGMIAGGGALLIWQDELGLSRALAIMAAGLAVATLPILATREPARAKPTPEHSTRAHFLRRPGALKLLLAIALYKAGDAFATGMLRPFLVDRGLGLRDVGWLLGTLGFVAGLLGAVAGGASMNRLSRRSALVTFGLLQAASIFGYAALARGPLHTSSLYLVCGLEHFAGGLATAALFTCMMDWCARETGAVDYTVQASAVVIATGAATALAGVSAQAFGYVGHFTLAAGASLLTLWLMARSFPSGRDVALLRGEAVEVT